MGDVETIKLLPSVENFVDGLEGFLARHHGALVDEVPSDGVSPAELVWSLAGGAEVQYVEDPYLNVQYVVITGRDVLPLAQELAEVVPSWTLDQVAARWDREAAHDPRIAASLAIALGVLGPAAAAPPIVARLAQALAHEDAAVRQSAAFAVRLLAWPELRDAAAQRLRVELHPEVQAALELATRA